jgi:hypothetical protein
MMRGVPTALLMLDQVGNGNGNGHCNGNGNGNGHGAPLTPAAVED